MIYCNEVIDSDYNWNDSQVKNLHEIQLIICISKFISIVFLHKLDKKVKYSPTLHSFS